MHACMCVALSAEQLIYALESDSISVAWRGVALKLVLHVEVDVCYSHTFLFAPTLPTMRNGQLVRER